MVEPVKATSWVAVSNCCAVRCSSGSTRNHKSIQQLHPKVSQFIPTANFNFEQPWTMGHGPWAMGQPLRRRT